MHLQHCAGMRSRGRGLLQELLDTATSAKHPTISLAGRNALDAMLEAFSDAVSRAACCSRGLRGAEMTRGVSDDAVADYLARRARRQEAHLRPTSSGGSMSEAAIAAVAEDLRQALETGACDDEFEARRGLLTLAPTTWARGGPREAARLLNKGRSGDRARDARRSFRYRVSLLDVCIV